MEKIRKFSGLDKQEIINKLPLVEITGHNRVLIENHQGLIGYSLDEIQIKVCYGKIIVTGCKLNFAEINREQLVVMGEIYGVMLYRG